MPLSEQQENESGGCAPALLHLSSPLPCSLSRLGLTLSNTAATSQTESPSTQTPPRAAAAAAALAEPSPSFRVRAVHYDDVARDVILACEDSVTLFVPLDCDASDEAKDQGNTQQHQQQASSPASTRPAVAVGLRLGNPVQAWVPPPPLPTATVSPTAPRHPQSSVSAGPSSSSPSSWQSERHPIDASCLPRRLPMPTPQLRRAASVLVAVPVLSMPSSTPSAAAAAAEATADVDGSHGDGSARAAVRSVMSVVIMECAVLPEGVDCIEAAAVPLARPLRTIMCVPNTLRFREAWYPLHWFCWCGPQETLGVASCMTGSVAGGASRGAHNNKKPHPTDSRQPSPEGYGGEGEAAADPSAASRCSYTDYYLLCVSSISIDLLRVRHQRRDGFTSNSDTATLEHRQHGSTAYQPDITAMMNSGRAVHPSYASSSFAAAATPPDVGEGDAETAWRDSSPPSSRSTIAVTTATAAAATRGPAEIAVALMQRYITRTDWCVYEPRSRTLVSINYTRPDVLKPMEVRYERCTPHAAAAPVVASSLASPGCGEHVAVSLWKQSELTLPESLCVSLFLNSPALPHDPRIARLLPSVVGVFTVYGQTFLYHVPLPRIVTRSGGNNNNSRGGGGRGGDSRAAAVTARMNLYVFLPQSQHEAASSALSPTSPAAAPGAAAGLFPSRPHAHGEAAGVSPSSPTSGSPTGFFKRLSVAASAATATAAPPLRCSGAHVRVAQLILDPLLPPQPTRASPSSPSSLLSAAAPSVVAAPSVSPLTAVGLTPPPVRPSQQQQQQQQQQLCLLSALSLQVSGNLIVLHNMRASVSAVFDLAVCTHTLSSDGGATTRDYVVWLAASEQSRRWARTLRISREGSLSPSSPAPALTWQTAAAANSSATPSSAAAQGHAGALDASSGRRPGYGGAVTSDPMWSRAAGSDWTSMMSAVTSSMLELSSSVGVITGGSGGEGGGGEGDALALPLAPLYCCSVTTSLAETEEAVDNREDTTTATATLTDATGIDRESSDDDEGSGQRDTSCQAVEVPYQTCLWPSNSCSAFAVSKHDGSLRRCQLDSAALAEWLALVLRASQASDTSGGESRRGGPATVAAAAGLSSASLAQLVAFTCRHPADVQCYSGVGDEQGNDCSDGGTAYSAPLQTLKEVAWRLVMTQTPTSAALADAVQPYGAVLQRHLSLGTAPRPQLLATWMDAVESLTVETALLSCVHRQAGRRLLAPVPGSASESSSSWGNDDAGNLRGAEHTAADAHGGAALQLQSHIVTQILRPLWETVLTSQPTATSQHDVPDASSYLVEQRLRAQLCEALLCRYVRTLRSLSTPVLPALYQLVLDVVLRCDADMNTRSQVGEDGDEPPSVSASLPSLVAEAARTARRACALLRQGVLEESCVTARAFLGWWERLRYTMATYPQACGHTSSTRQGTAAGSAEAQEDSGCVVQECPEAELLFQEAVRMLAISNHRLEVVEAHRWRRDYSTAAAALLRLPRNTTPVEVTEVRGASRRASAAAHVAAPSGELSASSSSSFSSSLCVAGVSMGATQRCTTRLLTWDTLAVAVLDGAWRAVRTAEECCYVLAEQTAAVQRGGRATAAATAAAQPLGESRDAAGSALVETPPAWQLRAAEREVQAARRVYLSVASSLLSMPGVSVSHGESTHVATAAASAVSTSLHGDSLTEFNPTVGEAQRGTHAAHRLGQQSLFNPNTRSIHAGYQAHEVRYAQLRQQVETESARMKAGW